MKKYKYEIKSFLEKNKELNTDELTEKVIKEYIALDNQLSKAMAKGNLSEDELEELELRVLQEQQFTLHFLLGGHYGYNIRERNGYNQWYREAKLIEETEDKGSL